MRSAGLLWRVALVACVAAGDLSASDVESFGAQDLLDGVVQVKVARGASSPEAAASVAARVMGCAAPRRVFRRGGAHEARHVAFGLDRWFEADCASPDAPRSAAAARAVARYRDRAEPTLLREVEVVEPALRVSPSGFLPDDPLVGEQRPHLEAARVFGAWDFGATGTDDVVVHVVDSGTDVGHPDLVEALWVNGGEVCGNGVDDDSNGYVDDCHGYNHADDSGAELLGASSHGTHCGGLAAATTGNGRYVAGVAGGDGGATTKGARLMTSVVFGASGRNRGFPQAIVYGADHGAHVTSLSWTFTSPNAWNQVVLDAIDYATRAGVSVVAATGNHGSGGEKTWYPAAHAGCLAVTATDRGDRRAAFANHGPYVDVAAPGEKVLSTAPDAATATMTGTSFAAPIVAGVLALMRSVARDGATARDLEDCLLRTARRVRGDARGEETGAGLVDAARAVRCAAGADEAAPTRAPTRHVDVIYDDDACADSASWYRKGKRKRTCAWVAKRPRRRCAKKDKAKVRAVAACRAACAAIWPNTIDAACQA